MCKIDAINTRPEHTFVPIYEHIVSVERAQQRHAGIYCNGELCDMKQTFIIGDRYKCTVCDDTDFCASCEALPRNTHNRTHPLIKFKTPVRNVTVSTFGGKDDGSPRMTVGDQQPQTSSKATETMAPASCTNAATQIQAIAEVKPIEPAVREQSQTAAKSPEPIDPTAGLTAHFVKDTVSDGTNIAPGSQFVQTWTLHNPGPRAWPANCSVFFIGGDGMLDVDPNHPSQITRIRKAIKSNTIEQEVKAGNSIDVKVAMRAPEREGKAISYWRLKTKHRIPFGDKLWCDISIKKPAQHEEAATVDHVEDVAAHQPRLEDEAEVAGKEVDPATSTMIFPKLDEESPVSSIPQDAQTAAPEAVAAPVPAPVDDLLDVGSLELDEDVNEDSDEGFLTDEEYELIASGDEMEVAKNGKK